MPGIAGLITKLPREQAEQELMHMCASLWREPCYVGGVWMDESMGVYVAWNARQDSPSADMPVCNEENNIVLVFSGEDYPDRRMGRQLAERGHVLNQHALSYLVHVCEDDSTFPAGLNGRFHGIVIDRRHGTAAIFNDRYGMHRLYWHESNDAFYFAAEAKAILSVRPELRTTDLQGLGELVACGCVLENRTVFKGIQVLPPGASWTFRNGRLAQKRTYFQPTEWEEQEHLTEELYYEELKEVFARSLPKYFDGPEKVGMSLTGGLDTRMIMAWQQSPPGSLPCYSFGDMLRDTHDVRVAREVAQACGQPYEVIPIENEFLSRFAYYAERTVRATDGCAGVDCAADLYANERAAQIAPVRMTGNYGSEVLRSVRAFKPAEPASDLFHPELVKHAHTAGDTYSELLHCNPLSFAVFRQAPWHHFGLLALEETQLTVRSPYLDNDLVRTVFRAPGPTLTGNEISLRLIADGNMKLRRIQTDRGFAGEQGPIASALSRGLLQFTFKAEYAYDYGMPQWVARIDHLLSPAHPERLFLGRHKFNHFRIWYRDTLSGYVQEILLDSRTLSRPYLNRGVVETVVRHHVNGDRNYTTAIHKLLTLELLHRLFLD